MLYTSISTQLCGSLQLGGLIHPRYLGSLLVHPDNDNNTINVAIVLNNIITLILVLVLISCALALVLCVLVLCILSTPSISFVSIVLLISSLIS